MSDPSSCETQMLPPAATTAEYLKLLFGEDLPGYIILWIKDESRQRTLCFQGNDLRAVASEAAKLSMMPNTNVFMGMGIRKEDLGAYKRGTAEDIIGISCLWLDIDIQDPAHKETRLPKDVTKAKKIIAGFPLAPSMYVLSGHGIYPLWLLDKPWFFENKIEKERAQDLLRNFHRVMVMLFKKEGFQIDNVSDLSRVLRMPNSVNYKAEPVPVVFNAPQVPSRYSVEELVSAAAACLAKLNSANPPQVPVSMQAETDDRPMDATLIIQRCAFIGHCIEDAAELPEPDWFFGTVSILARTKDGATAVHKYSRSYPNYNFAETEAKIAHALKDAGPSTCLGIQDKCGTEYCQECIFHGLISSPMALGQGQDTEQITNMLEFPIEALPEQLREYAVQGAEAICAPVDFIAVPLLVCAGGVIGNSTRLELKPGWQESAGLYAAIVGDPAAKKSPSLKVASRFLDEFAAVLEALYQDELSTYKAEINDYNQGIDDYTAGKVQDKPRKPKEPQRQRLNTVDTTVEALAVLMYENPLGIIVIRDELSAWTKSMNQYKSGGGSDLQFYLSCWNGAAYTVDRKGKDPIILPRTFLGVVGCIPPDVLQEITGNQGQNDGFMDRILFSYPQPVRQRWTDKTISKQVEDQARECFGDLFRLRTGVTTSTDARVVSLSLRAQTVFTSWHDLHYAEMEVPSFPPGLRGFWGKMPGQVARLALILHCCSEEKATSVSEETMRMAIQLGEYFKANARRVFNTLDDTQQAKNEAAVLNWMIRKDLRQVSVRELLTTKVKGCVNAKETRLILSDLVSKGLGIWSDIKPDVFIRM